MNRELQNRHFLIELFRQEVQIRLAGLGTWTNHASRIPLDVKKAGTTLPRNENVSRQQMPLKQNWKK